MSTMINGETSVNPGIEHAAAQVAVLLMDYGYSWADRQVIRKYVEREGTVTGAPGLDPVDEADAAMVLEESFPAVDFDDLAAWGDDGFDDASEAFREAVRNFELEPIPAGEDDDALPPICGGAPEYTDQDYEDWLDSLDASYPPDDQAEPSDRDFDRMYASRGLGDAADPSNPWF